VVRSVDAVLEILQAFNESVGLPDLELPTADEIKELIEQRKDSGGIQMGWTAVATRTGGVKAVGNAEHQSKVLYGEQARKALQGPQEKPKAEKPAAKVAKKKEEPAKEEPKPEKPTVEKTVATVQELRQKGFSTEGLLALAQALHAHTVKELTAIKSQLGIKASGVKAELAKKIAERALALDTAAKEEPKKEEPKPAKVKKEAKPKPAKEETKAEEPKSDITQLTPKDLSHEVYDAIREIPQGKADGQGDWFGGNKVFISSIFDKLKAKFPDMTEDEFKAALLKANQSMDLNLVRADMAPDMNQTNVKRSEMRPYGEGGPTFHFVKLPDKGTPGTEHIPDRNTREEPKPEPKPAKVETKPKEPATGPKTKYKVGRSHKGDPDLGIVMRSGDGEKNTDLDEANGKRVSDQLGDLLPQAYDHLRHMEHSKQEATIPQMYKWLKEKVPGLTMADLQDALWHQKKAGNITLQVHNEVSQLAEPTQAIWEKGAALNWVNAPKWQGAGATKEEPAKPVEKPLPKAEKAAITKPNPGGRDDQGIIEYKGDKKTTAIDDKNGEKVASAIGDDLRKAYDYETLFIEHQDGIVPINRLFNRLKKSRPELTMPALQDALAHLAKKRDLQLHVQNEVHKMVDPNQAIWQDGLAYFYVIMPQKKD
jgi:hypothetical protein